MQLYMTCKVYVYTQLATLFLFHTQRLQNVFFKAPALPAIPVSVTEAHGLKISFCD